MRVLSLFSGGGLGDFGLMKAGMEIVGQVEWDKYCQKILKLRWPDVPKWEDVRNVRGTEVISKCGKIDLIAGGFPCQPFSVAGKKKGKEDERNMWPAMYRIISEVKPAWVLAENVRGIVKPYLDTVLTDLEGLGYTCLPLLIPASAVGAPHRRERLWIVAYSNDKRRGARGDNERENENNFSQIGESEKNKQQRNIGKHRTCAVGEIMAHADSSGWKERRRSEPIQEKFDTIKCSSEDVADSTSGRQLPWASESGADGSETGWPEPHFLCDKRTGQSWWAVEPAVGRVAHGIASRVDRLKLLGNGQVVQVVEYIGTMIMEFNRGIKS